MMRYPTERENRMNEIEKNFIDYLIFDKYHDISTATLKNDAPAEAVESFTEWHKLYKEQKEKDDRWPIA